jgi:Tfp pilus assembly protein PilX
MKSHYPTEHSGFSVIEVLLAILVIVVLAVTGFVVYQRHKPITAKNSAATTSTQTTTRPPQTTTQYLTITEWGIKLPLSDSIKDAYYVVSTGSQDVNGQPNTMWLGLTSLSGDCNASQANKPGASIITSIGALGRALPTDHEPVKGTLYTQLYPGITIGGYYYFYISGTNGKTCAPQSTLQSIDSAFAAAAKGIVAAPATQYLEIKEWGIKVKLEDADKLTYTINGTPNGTSANADGIVSYAALSLKDSITTSQQCKPLTTSISQHLVASNTGEGANMTTVGKYAYGIDGGPNSCADTAINTLQQKIFSELLKRNIAAE